MYSLCMVRDGNYTYCGKQFSMYANVKSLHCTHETHRILDVNYISVKHNWYINTAYYKYADSRSR